jgi:hypothetical protein
VVVVADQDLAHQEPVKKVAQVVAVWPLTVALLPLLVVSHKTLEKVSMEQADLETPMPIEVVVDQVVVQAVMLL